MTTEDSVSLRNNIIEVLHKRFIGDHKAAQMADDILATIREHEVSGDITQASPVYDDLSERLKVIGNECTGDLRCRLHELALSIKVLGRNETSKADARIAELEAERTDLISEMHRLASNTADEKVAT